MIARKQAEKAPGYWWGDKFAIVRIDSQGSHITQTASNMVEAKRVLKVLNQHLLDHGLEGKYEIQEIERY